MKKLRIYLTPELEFDLIPQWETYHQYSRDYVNDIIGIKDWNFAYKWLFIKLHIEIKIK